jgi:hypothetical protein
VANSPQHLGTAARRPLQRAKWEGRHMALAVIRSIDSECAEADWLSGRYDRTKQEQIVERLRANIAAYEARYCISSERIHEAIEAGDLIEDTDVADWIFEYRILSRVRAR